MRYFYNGEKGTDEEKQRKKQKPSQGFLKVVEKHGRKVQTGRCLRMGDFGGKSKKGVITGRKEERDV